MGRSRWSGRRSPRFGRALHRGTPSPTHEEVSGEEELSSGSDVDDDLAYEELMADVAAVVRARGAKRDTEELAGAGHMPF